MRRFASPILLTLALLAALGAAPAHAGDHRLGFGFHYWKTLDELKDDNFGGIKDKGTSQVLSYQYLPGGLLRFELDLEYFDKGFGGSTSAAWAPQAYVLVGRGFYGGVGIGATRSSGLPKDSWSDPWYAAKAGIDLLLLPAVHLDISANYRNNVFNELDNFDSDTITLSAIARFAF
ncbi:MAG: hypothetical protein U0X73_02895 [Thermoanaerobaculia bacterium]